MIVYFVRHASAGRKLTNPKKEERRPLDEEGILQARYVGRLLASLLANELAFENAIQKDNALRPDGEFEQFQEMVSRYRKYEAIAVVGHNPNLTECLSKTISGPAGAAHIEF